MILELEPYKEQTKSEFRSYMWRIENDVYEKIDLTAKENNVYPSVVMRYIINWACDKMSTDKEFKKHILALTLSKNYTGTKERKMFRMSKNVNDKLTKTNEKYRLNNLSYFANESARIFFEENK